MSLNIYERLLFITSKFSIFMTQHFSIEKSNGSTPQRINITKASRGNPTQCHDPAFSTAFNLCVERESKAKVNGSNSMRKQ